MIHLVREDQLASHVSFQLALLEDNWIGEPFRTDSQLTIDIIDHLQSWFDWGEHYQEDYDERFREHSILRLTYEQLTSDFQSTMTQVCHFLTTIAVLFPPAIAS